MGRISIKDIAGEALKRGYARLATDMGGPMRSLNLRSGSVGEFRDITIPNFSSRKDRHAKLLSGHFVYANQELDIGAQGDPWTIPAPSERFAFWLHSFDWMDDLLLGQDKQAVVRARYLVDRWVEIFGDWNAYAWDNDILAARLFNWLKHWSPTLRVDNLSDLATQRRSNVERQLKRLRGTFGRTPPGLHRLTAATSLALGGIFMPGDPDKFLNRGLDWLDTELDIQILADGGHISRSPAQTVKALHILTCLDEALDKAGIEPTRVFQRALERLRHLVPFFMYQDGRLACFNGSGQEHPGFLKALMKHSSELSKLFTYCPHTGYQRITQGDTLIMVDTGETPPLRHDAQAHLAPLAFEMSTGAGRLIVNCGWSEEQPQSWRGVMRETAAHSTLSLSNMAAGQLVEDGIQAKLFEASVKKSVGTVKASRMEQDTGVWLEMSHMGYQERTGLAHRRRLYVKSDGQDIRGEDSLLVPIGSVPISRDSLPFDIRFHLHPSVRATLAQDLHSALLIQPGKVGWRFRTDGGPMRIEESVYLGTGHRPVKTEQIVISGQAFADSDGETKSNRVRWSIKRLDAS